MTVRHVRLGRTALKVSRLCLGTLNFGVRTTREEGFVVMDAALDRGVNFFDTANNYGWQVHKGFTEELIGEWFGRDGARREKVVLGTKVCQPMSDRPNDQGLSARHIIASCDASLRRLRTDWIDLFQLHDMDFTAPWDEVWTALEVLIGQGKVRYVGTSNFAAWYLVSAQEAALRRGNLGVVSEQCVYNLVRRGAEAELIPATTAYGVGVFAWSPLHGGLLGGAVRKLADGTAVKTAQGRAEVEMRTRRDRITEYEKLCADLGADPAEVALSWVLTRPGITGAVIGPRTLEHLVSAERALEAPLDDEVAGKLDELFPA